MLCPAGIQNARSSSTALFPGRTCFTPISIKLRIAVAVLLLAALLVLTGSLGIAGMTSSNDANRDTFSVKLPGATDIGDAETGCSANGRRCFTAR
jgi:Tar ligand binding domain homologue